MPQMEKFGYASSRTTVTSAAGSTSRARSAALIPASLPPIMTRCMAGSPPVASGVAVVGDDDAGGIGRGDGRVQRLDDRDGQCGAEDLGADEGRGRGRGDSGEGGR